jgi:hypothetical protein
MEERWIDLANNRPGEAVAKRAKELRREAPVLTALARIIGVHTEERAYRIGAQGEGKVAGRLHQLPPGWRAIHSIPVGSNGSDIDHIVIGPGGIFSLNAKHHPDANIWVKGDTFLINGHRFPYVPKSRYEAKRVGRILTTACGSPVSAIGVVVVAGARRGFTVKEQPSDGLVFVVGGKFLVKWLLGLPTTLSQSQITMFHDVARRSTTWQ